MDGVLPNYPVAVYLASEADALLDQYAAREKRLIELADEWEQNASGTPQAIAARMWCIQELRTILNEGEKK